MKNRYDEDERRFPLILAGPDQKKVGDETRFWEYPRHGQGEGPLLSLTDSTGLPRRSLLGPTRAIRMVHSSAESAESGWRTSLRRYGLGLLVLSALTNTLTSRDAWR